MIIFGDILGDPVVGILLSLPRAQVQSLVGELRSHKLCGVVKKKKKVIFLGCNIREKLISWSPCGS